MYKFAKSQAEVETKVYFYFGSSLKEIEKQLEKIALSAIVPLRSLGGGEPEFLEKLQQRGVKVLALDLDESDKALKVGPVKFSNEEGSFGKLVDYINARASEGALKLRELNQCMASCIADEIKNGGLKEVLVVGGPWDITVKDFFEESAKRMNLKVNLSDAFKDAGGLNGRQEGLTPFEELVQAHLDADPLAGERKWLFGARTALYLLLADRASKGGNNHEKTSKEIIGIVGKLEGGDCSKLYHEILGEESKSSVMGWKELQGLANRYVAVLEKTKEPWLGMVGILGSEGKEEKRRNR